MNPVYLTPDQLLEPDFQTVHQAYENHMLLKNYSMATVKTYLCNFRKYNEWCVEKRYRYVIVSYPRCEINKNTNNKNNKDYSIKNSILSPINYPIKSIYTRKISERMDLGRFRPTEIHMAVLYIIPLSSAQSKKMKLFYAIILILTIFCSCQSQDNKVDNISPMYGGVEKSKEHKEIDEKFIQDCLKQFGSIDSSVNVQIDHAWRYFYNDDLGTAMKRFNQAWLLNPEFPDSYFGFAALLEMQYKSKEATHFYNLGIKKDKRSSRTEICYQRIADCKEQLNDIEGTIKAYENIALVNPNNSFAFKKLGYFKMQSKNTQEAIDAYNKAIQLDPTDAMTYNNRAYLYQTLQNHQLAIDDYTKAIKLNPSYISALVNRGITEMQISKFKEAKIDFEKSVVLDPEAGELRRFLGLAKLNLNELAEACSDFVLAKQMGDPNASQLIMENCEK